MGLEGIDTWHRMSQDPISALTEVNQDLPLAESHAQGIYTCMLPSVDLSAAIGATARGLLGSLGCI